MIRRILVTLTAVLSGLLILPVAAHAAPSDTVKVVVVRTPEQNDGRSDTLALIAARDLGDQGRASEIFALNQGRKQADGDALTSADQQLHPGWILRVPDDADGPDVRLGQITAASKPYLTWKLVLALIGAVILGLITMLVVFRRWFVRRFRAVRESMRLRRRVQQRQRLRQRLAATFAQDRITPELAYRSAAELNDAAVEAYGLQAGARGVTAWVTTDRQPSPPWQERSEGVWVRDASATALTTSTGAGKTNPCLVRVGGGENETLFVDLTWLDGVLAIGGDPAVAAAALRCLLTDLVRFRGDVQVISIGPTAAGVPAQAVHLRSVGELRPGPGDEPGDGIVLLAARRRTVAGLVVVPVPLNPDEAAHLLLFCERTGHAAVILGDLPGAHWRWTAEPDGSITVPSLGTTVTVPS